MPLVNDVHSGLNPTRVSDIVFPNSHAALCRHVAQANSRGTRIAVCGGRHAMGGQQFSKHGRLLDLSRLDRILAFDSESGLLRVEAGIQWPALLSGYHGLQHNHGKQWGIAQKQTGADRLSIGGAMAANIHGRGLAMAPFGADVVSATVIRADGASETISRTRNPDLFAHVLGGYGLFGAIYDVTLQLRERTKLRREVCTLSLAQLPENINHRIQAGYLYADYQFDIDPASDYFLKRGIFSSYHPCPLSTPMTDNPVRLSADHWRKLLVLAHTNKAAAYDKYCAFYKTTHGQIYWSDTHQLSYYLDNYHAAVDELAPAHAGSEVIIELYVDLNDLPAFMTQAARLLRQNRADLIYGTIRVIRRDRDSALPWAQRDSACVVFNLHTSHGPGGKAKCASQQRDLIDLALQFRGRFFLTYHRCATDRQLLQAYPTFPNFLRAKRRYDPDETFYSDWYAHHRHLAQVRSMRQAAQVA